MNLLVDIGNSRIKWAQQTKNELHSFAGCKYKQDDLSNSLSSYWDNISRPENVYVSNVAGVNVFTELSEIVSTAWSISAEQIQVGAEAAGIVNGYDDYSQLGVDRWLAMIGAWDNYKGAFCVVDCGTALTIDMVLASGQHQGGFIVPGISLMTELLNAGTEQINAQTRISVRPELGRNTRDCVSNGASLAVRALIDSVFADVKKDQGVASHCIITGGYAGEIRHLLATDVDYHPHLVLNGMAILISGSS